MLSGTIQTKGFVNSGSESVVATKFYCTIRSSNPKATIQSVERERVVKIGFFLLFF
jgi:hypothetical protein